MAKKKLKAKTPEQLVLEIQENCRMLGWNIAMNENDAAVRGLIIGQDTWVGELVEQLNDSFSVYASADSIDNKGVH
jgi:hypothetical protein